MSRHIIIALLLIFVALLCPQSIRAAKAKAKKTDPSEILQKAQQAYINYEFSDAEDLLDEYESLMTKAKKPVAEEAEELKTRLNTAINAFGRVQKIEIIDSLTMPRNKFFEAYRLSQSAGRIGRPNSFSLDNNFNGREVSYLNEDEDYFITSETDADGNLKLTEMRRLLDGSWRTQDLLIGNFEKEGDYAYPFLAGDGQTLYFANNGDGSMGGYDIFVAQKDPISGESLQPLNIGMPFNSPFDDFMMAIDEERGIGWWATDRNNPGGNVTIFVYLLDEVRQNYSTDTEGLEDFAKITSFKETWKSGKESEYSKIKDSYK